MTINFTGTGDAARAHRLRRRDADLEDELPPAAGRQGVDGPAGLGDRGESDRERLERRVALAGERPADLVHRWICISRSTAAADGRAGAVRGAAAAGVRRRHADVSDRAGRDGARAHRATRVGDAMPDGRQRWRCSRRSSITAGASSSRCLVIDRASRRHGDEARRAVPVHRRQRDAGAPEVGDAADRHRHRRVERLSIYNASVLPTQSAQRRATQEHDRQAPAAGPVTVLDKGGYAGDARIDNVPPGQERLLSYGIDLDMLGRRHASTRDDVRHHRDRSSRASLLLRSQARVVAGVRGRQQVGPRTRCSSSSIRSATAGSSSTRRSRRDDADTSIGSRETAAANKVTIVPVKEDGPERDDRLCCHPNIDAAADRTVALARSRRTSATRSRRRSAEAGAVDVERQIAERGNADHRDHGRSRTGSART